MPDNNRIVDEQLKAELAALKEIYNKLEDKEKELLRQEAPLLSGVLEEINPQNATYRQIRTLARLSADAGEFELAFGVLQRFKETEVYKRATVQNLDKLTHPPLRHIFTYMNKEEKANVEVATSRGFLHPHDRMSRLGQALLSHTIKGNQDIVEAMLKRYPELLLYRGNVRDYSGREFKQVTALELASWALDVRHMAPAMLKCLTDNEYGKDYRKDLAPELQQQFNNVVKDDGGVNYTIGCALLKMSKDPRTLLPGKTNEENYAELNRALDRHDGLIQYEDKLFYFHNLIYPKKLVEITNPEVVMLLKVLMNKKERKLEVDKLQIINNDDELKMVQEIVPDSRHIFREKHYDFTPLRRALDVYIHSGSTSTWDQREADWCTVVGLAQHYAPSHVAQHYCNPDESFDPLGDPALPRGNVTLPTFKEKVLRRVLMFDNWLSPKKEHWWLAGAVSSPVLGSAAVSGPGLNLGIYRAGRRRGAAASDMSPATLAMFVRVDLAAIAALCKARTDDALELKQLLDSLQKPEAGPEPARCVVQ